jgi:hypothetical protein
MKILYLADIRFPMERANGIQTIETAHALARRGLEVDLVVRRTDGRSDEACLEFFGLPPSRPSLCQRVSAPFGKWSYLARRSDSCSRARRWNFAYPRSRPRGSSPCAWGLLSLRGPHVAAVRGGARALYGPNEPLKAKLERLDKRERRVCRDAAGIVTITEAPRRHSRIGTEDRSRCRSGRNAASGEARPRSTAAPPPRVLHRAALSWKGVGVLVEAMRVRDADCHRRQASAEPTSIG